MNVTLVLLFHEYSYIFVICTRKILEFKNSIELFSCLHLILDTYLFKKKNMNEMIVLLTIIC